MISNLHSFMHSHILIPYSLKASTIDLLEQIYPVPFNKQQVKLELREFLTDGEIDPTTTN